MGRSVRTADLPSKFIGQLQEILSMQELIQITPHSSGSGFDIPFPNGTVTVPDACGGYCISSGCGSGKTESIKSLIRQKYDSGILYCVDTISECEKMFQWVHKELADTGIISKSDVMMINSKADFEHMKTYYDRPELITTKKILIVVQVRFFIELINYFLLYNPRTPPQAFRGDFGSLMASGNLRKYVIFDETPLFLKPFYILTKGELAPYAVKKNGHWVCKSPVEVQEVYKAFINGDRKMGYNNSQTKLATIKNDVIISHVIRLFPSWMSQKGKDYRIQFYPSDLIQPGMKTHVLLYEGAGDVLLGSGSSFKLLDLPGKYKSTVCFHPFTFDLKRKKLPTPQEYSDFVSEISQILMTCSGKTLVVIWKDFKASQLTDVPNDTYTTKLTDALVQVGMDQESFTVTYYGASDTKSTNVYREYENIILCGRWNLGPSVVGKLKEGFDCQTACTENYMMWYYVQLLLRIGIRNNIPGKTYHVYYSSDHSQGFIFRLDVYLNQNIFIPKNVSQRTPLWVVIVLHYKMGKHFLKSIRALVGHDPKVTGYIEKSKPYTYSISLKDIATLIPMKKKRQKGNYKALIRFMRNFYVILNIT